MNIPDFVETKYSYFLISSIEKSIEEAINKNKPALSFTRDIPNILKELASNAGLLLSVESFGVSDFTVDYITFSICVKIEHSEDLALKLLDSLVSLDIKTDDFVEYIKNDIMYSRIFTHFRNILPYPFFKNPLLKESKIRDPVDIFKCLINNSRLKSENFKIDKISSSFDKTRFSLEIPLSSLHKNITIEVSELFSLNERRAKWVREKERSIKEYESDRVPALLVSDIQYQGIKIEIDEIKKEINTMMGARDEIYKIIQEKYNELSRLNSLLSIRKSDLVSSDKKSNLPVKTDLSFPRRRLKLLSKCLDSNLL